jgi:hypothetical protein
MADVNGKGTRDPVSTGPSSKLAKLDPKRKETHDLLWENCALKQL